MKIRVSFSVLFILWGVFKCIKIWYILGISSICLQCGDFLLFAVVLNILRHTAFITLGTSAIFSSAAFTFTQKCLTADGTKSQNGVFQNVYTDEGISGTNTKKRDGFNEMIADALAEKISLILTKSVSRFARNTVDSLTTIIKLKAHGTEVYF